MKGVIVLFVAFSRTVLILASDGEHITDSAEESVHIPSIGFPHTIYFGYPYQAVHPGILAVAVLKASSGENGPSGSAIFFQPRPPDGPVFITGNITGLPKGPHGLHIHRDGDLRNGCESVGPHYNPFLHGGPADPHRHVGDLGNIVADENGNVKLQIMDNLISLVGLLNIAGRSLVIHENEDDLGRGGNPESLQHGNSGGRLACGIIGYAYNNPAQ